MSRICQQRGFRPQNCDHPEPAPSRQPLSPSVQTRRLWLRPGHFHSRWRRSEGRDMQMQRLRGPCSPTKGCARPAWSQCHKAAPIPVELALHADNQGPAVAIGRAGRTCVSADPWPVIAQCLELLAREKLWRSSSRACFLWNRPCAFFYCLFFELWFPAAVPREGANLK